MRVSVNLKFETPEGMSITDFVDAVEKVLCGEVNLDKIKEK